PLAPRVFVRSCLASGSFVASLIFAIVGRPNVGKSTLFNRLVGFRKAIVDPLAGLTRDRLYGVAEWRGRELTAVDTAGLGPAEDATVAQTRIAIEEAHVIVLLLDVQIGRASRRGGV